MYIMKPVIGSCLTGARATSQAFLSLSVSVSAVVGGARMEDLDVDCCFWELLEQDGRDERGRTLLRLVDV